MLAGSMSPFEREMNFSSTEICTITKIYGMWIGIAGVFLGRVAGDDALCRALAALSPFRA
jgi:hypothetical protein